MACDRRRHVAATRAGRATMPRAALRVSAGTPRFFSLWLLSLDIPRLAVDAGVSPLRQPQTYAVARRMPPTLRRESWRSLREQQQHTRASNGTFALCYKRDAPRLSPWRRRYTRRIHRIITRHPTRTALPSSRAMATTPRARISVSATAFLLLCMLAGLTLLNAAGV